MTYYNNKLFKKYIQEVDNLEWLNNRKNLAEAAELYKEVLKVNKLIEKKEQLIAVLKKKISDMTASEV